MNKQKSLTPLYKILPRAAWREAREAGIFRGAGIDLTDGYIHLSTAEQVEETAALHFAGQTDLVLIALGREALLRLGGTALRWEPSRGGQLFPHLYASLPLDCVVWSRDLPWIEGEGHRFPAQWKNPQSS